MMGVSTSQHIILERKWKNQGWSDRRMSVKKAGEKRGGLLHWVTSFKRMCRDGGGSGRTGTRLKGKGTLSDVVRKEARGIWSPAG